MLALLPGDLSLLVKVSFLGNFPADMRDHVQEGAELLSYQQLAARADSIWQARRANRPAVVAAVTEPVQSDQQVDPGELEQVLVAVRFSKQRPKQFFGNKQGGQGSQGGQQSSSSLQEDKMKGWCRRHRRFGDRAFACDKPTTCTYSKN